MIDRKITILEVHDDGRFLKLSFEAAYFMAVSSVNDKNLCYESWQLEHDRAVRHFAKTQLFGHDAGYFLHRANVTLRETEGESQYAYTSLQEAYSCLYDESPRDFTDGYSQASTAMAFNPSRVPRINEVILSFEFH